MDIALLFVKMKLDSKSLFDQFIVLIDLKTKQLCPHLLGVNEE